MIVCSGAVLPTAALQGARTHVHVQPRDGRTLKAPSGKSTCGSTPKTGTGGLTLCRYCAFWFTMFPNGGEATLKSKGAEQNYPTLEIMDDPVSPPQGWEREHLTGSSCFHMEMMRVLILNPAPVPSPNPPAPHNDPNPLMLTVRMFFFIYFAGFCFYLRFLLQ